jgi:hypothetical protein
MQVATLVAKADWDNSKMDWDIRMFERAYSRAATPVCLLKTDADRDRNKDSIGGISLAAVQVN